MKNEDLRNLCIKNNWYTRGTIAEYEHLFEMNSNGAMYAELAMDIFCKSADVRIREIEEELMRADIPEINIMRLMKTLKNDGWTDKQISLIYLTVHGDSDNGKTYFTT